jgi:DNA-binding transcriptional regulator YhcF (GntR family)
LHSAAAASSIYTIMFDLQPDSPVPVPEQLASQVMAAVASGALKPGATLPEYRAFAQQLLTNPLAVSRAYAELEWHGVLRKLPAGDMEVAPNAETACRVRLQDAARQALAQAVRQAQACGLPQPEIVKAVEQALAAPPAAPLSAAELQTAIKKTAHASRHRDSQGIQVLPPAEGGG